MSHSADNLTSPSQQPRWKLTPGSLLEFVVRGGPRRWALAIVLLVFIALILMFLVRGLAMKLLVLPILYILWLLRFLLEGIPQPFFWFLAIFFFIRIVYPSLFGAKRIIHSPQLPEGGPPEGRVAFWLRRLTLAGTGQYSKWGMARNMAKLATDVLSYEDKITPGEVRERLQSGQYNLSPEIATYLRAGMSAQPPTSQSWWVRFLWGLGIRQNRDAQPTLNVDMGQLLIFLENEMEVVHDIENH